MALRKNVIENAVALNLASLMSHVNEQTPIEIVCKKYVRVQSPYCTVSESTRDYKLHKEKATVKIYDAAARINEFNVDVVARNQYKITCSAGFYAILRNVTHTFYLSYPKSFDETHVDADITYDSNGSPVENKYTIKIRNRTSYVIHMYHTTFSLMIQGNGARKNFIEGDFLKIGNVSKQKYSEYPNINTIIKGIAEKCLKSMKSKSIDNSSKVNTDSSTKCNISSKINTDSSTKCNISSKKKINNNNTIMTSNRVEVAINDCTSSATITDTDNTDNAYTTNNDINTNAHTVNNTCITPIVTMNNDTVTLENAYETESEEFLDRSDNITPKNLSLHVAENTMAVHNINTGNIDAMRENIQDVTTLNSMAANLLNENIDAQSNIDNIVINDDISVSHTYTDKVDSTDDRMDDLMINLIQPQATVHDNTSSNDNEDNGMPPNMKKYFDEIRIEKEMLKKRERRLNAEKNEINKKFQEIKSSMTQLEIIKGQSALLEGKLKEQSEINKILNNKIRIMKDQSSSEFTGNHQNIAYNKTSTQCQTQHPNNCQHVGYDSSQHTMAMINDMERRLRADIYKIIEIVRINNPINDTDKCKCQLKQKCKRHDNSHHHCKCTHDKCNVKCCESSECYFDAMTPPCCNVSKAECTSHKNEDVITRTRTKCTETKSVQTHSVQTISLQTDHESEILAFSMQDAPNKNASRNGSNLSYDKAADKSDDIPAAPVTSILNSKVLNFESINNNGPTTSNKSLMKMKNKSKKLKNIHENPDRSMNATNNIDTDVCMDNFARKSDRLARIAECTHLNSTNSGKTFREIKGRKNRHIILKEYPQANSPVLTNQIHKSDGPCISVSHGKINKSMMMKNKKDAKHEINTNFKPKVDSIVNTAVHYEQSTSEACNESSECYDSTIPSSRCNDSICRIESDQTESTQTKCVQPKSTDGESNDNASLYEWITPEAYTIPEAHISIYEWGKSRSPTTSPTTVMDNKHEYEYSSIYGEHEYSSDEDELFITAIESPSASPIANVCKYKCNCE